MPALAGAASLLIASSALAGPVDDANAGLDAFNAGDYEKAVKMFTRAIESGKLASDDKEYAYAERGKAYLKLGNRAAAATDFKRALKLKPDDQDAQAGLEEAQSGGGAPAEAHAQGYSGDPVKAAQAGMEALNGGDYARAIVMFTHAIESGKLSSDDMELALLSRGKAYTQKGQYREAVRDLNQALHIKTDDQEAQEAFAKAIVQIHAATPGTSIDTATCTKNFKGVGSIFSGKTYTGFAEYPTLAPLDAFAGVFQALSVYTPYPGQTWQVTAADLDAGTIKGAITVKGASNGSIQLPDRSITLEVHIEPLPPSGSRITVVEVVPGLFPTIDLKGSVCSTLADAVKG